MASARRETGWVSRGRSGRHWGAFAIAVGFAGYPLGLAVLLLPVGLEAGWTLRGAGAAAGGVVWGLSYAALRLGRHMRAPAGDWGALHQEPRPPIVYLRPFEVDGIPFVTSWRGRVRTPMRDVALGRTYEERLARALEDVAPVVAIDNPYGTLFGAGVTRLAAGDAEWEDRVVDLVSRGGPVILWAGSSDGLAWEVDHVVRHALPERIVIALPPDAPRGHPSRDARYAAFLRRFASMFPRPLPRRIGESQFLYFDADWRPQLFGQRGSPTLQAAPGNPGEQRARVLERLRTEFRLRMLPFWLRAAAGSAGMMVGLLVVGTLLYAALN